MSWQKEETEGCHVNWTNARHVDVEGQRETSRHLKGGDG